MTAKYFVDTNIFVYARDGAVPFKKGRAQELIRKLWQTHCGRISTQVLNELYSVLSGKFGLADDLIQADLRALFNWQPLAVNRAVVESAFTLRHYYKLSWWDCLIVAAALQLGCTKLFSEDLADGAVYLDVQVRNPFTEGFDVSKLDG